MDRFLEVVFQTQNIALILAVAGCMVCGWFHLVTRKEDRLERTKRDEQDRADRSKRDADAAAERAALYEVMRQNTSAMHELRVTLSAMNGKAF